jgi:hypothetical protein
MESALRKDALRNALRQCVAKNLSKTRHELIINPPARSLFEHVTTSMGSGQRHYNVPPAEPKRPVLKERKPLFVPE